MVRIFQFLSPAQRIGLRSTEAVKIKLTINQTTDLYWVESQVLKPFSMGEVRQESLHIGAGFLKKYLPNQLVLK
jgi:hypothetical protein